MKPFIRDLTAKLTYRVLPCMLATVAALVTAWSPAHAADARYPQRPITVIVPTAAGGPTDVVTRAVMQDVSRQLGQSVVIQNRPGANGQIATKALAESSPDGYTFSAVLAAHALNPSLYSKLPYNPDAVTGVTLLGKYPMLMLASAALPITSLADLKTYGKLPTNFITYASTGKGSLTHLLTERISRRLDIPMTHTPYSGNSAAMADLFTGRITLTFDTVLLSEQHVKTGKVRGLAISGDRRSPLLPDVPTLVELGYPDLETYGWIALIAPSGVPSAITERIAQAVTASANHPDVKKVLEANALQMTGGSPADTNAFLTAETETWGQVIRAANFTLD